MVYVLILLGGWHNKSVAIISHQQFIGLRVIHKGFRVGVELQPRAALPFQVRQIDFIVAEVGRCSVQCFAHVLSRGDWFEPLRHLLGRNQFTMAVRDVTQVTERARKMSFQNVGIEHLGAAAADGVNKVVGVALMIVPIASIESSRNWRRDFFDAADTSWLSIEMRIVTEESWRLLLQLQNLVGDIDLDTIFRNRQL